MTPQPTATATLVSAPPDAPASVRALMPRLSDAAPVERARAAHALGLMGPDAIGADDALLDLLGDEIAVYALFGLSQTSPAQEAATALARIGQPKGIVRLIDELQGPRRDRRALAANALYAAYAEGVAEMRRQGALGPLLGVAADAGQGSRVRANAVRALGRMNDGGAEPTVARLLRDPSETVRAAAAWTLGELGDCRSIPFLIEALAASRAPEALLYSSTLAAISGRELGDKPAAWRDWWANQSCP